MQLYYHSQVHGTSPGRNVVVGDRLVTLALLTLSIVTPALANRFRYRPTAVAGEQASARAPRPAAGMRDA